MVSPDLSTDESTIEPSEGLPDPLAALEEVFTSRGIGWLSRVTDDMLMLDAEVSGKPVEVFASMDGDWITLKMPYLRGLRFFSADAHKILFDNQSSSHGTRYIFDEYGDVWLVIDQLVPSGDLSIVLDILAVLVDTYRRTLPITEALIFGAKEESDDP